MGVLLEKQNVTGLTNAYRDFKNDVLGFAHAVDWSERWLLGLAAFHVLMWIVMIVTRKSHDAQMALL